MKDEKGNWLDADRSAVVVKFTPLEPWQKAREEAEKEVEVLTQDWHDRNPE